MSESVVGSVVPASGQVIDRPTGELALLWRLYAEALDRQQALKRETRKLRKKLERERNS